MNKGINLDLDTWIVPGQIRKANLWRGLGNSYKPAGTEVLISAVAHNIPPPFQAAQNATLLLLLLLLSICIMIYMRHALRSEWPFIIIIIMIYIVHLVRRTGVNTWITVVVR